MSKETRGLAKREASLNDWHLRAGHKAGVGQTTERQGWGCRSMIDDLTHSKPSTRWQETRFHCWEKSNNMEGPAPRHRCAKTAGCWWCSSAQRKTPSKTELQPKLPQTASNSTTENEASWALSLDDKIQRSAALLTRYEQPWSWLPVNSCTQLLLS